MSEPTNIQKFEAARKSAQENVAKRDELAKTINEDGERLFALAVDVLKEAEIICPADRANYNDAVNVPSIGPDGKVIPSVPLYLRGRGDRGIVEALQRKFRGASSFD